MGGHVGTRIACTACVATRGRELHARIGRSGGTAMVYIRLLIVSRDNIKFVRFIPTREKEKNICRCNGPLTILTYCVHPLMKR
jgi:hypothetical protein